MNLKPIQLLDLIQEAADVVKPQIKETGLNLSLELPDGLPKVLADPPQLERVFMNLLSNAIKYNHEQGSVTVTSSIAADGFLRLAVFDTGPGIPKELQGKLFQPFSRLGMEKSSSEGTGIGLSIAKKLVEMMGGRIGFESEAGKGTTFWFDLPVVG